MAELKQSAGAAPSPFHANLTARSHLKLYTGIAFVFAPIMVLSATRFQADHPWPALIFWFVVSGLLSVGWAASFVINKKLFFITIPAQIVAVVLFATRKPDIFALTDPRLSFDGILIIALVVAGYIFIVLFISGEGAKAFRLSTEMNLAAQIHASLVRDIDLTTDRAEILARSVASSEMGGDLIDVVQREDATDLFIIDVSGHGVRAGVLMGMIKSAIRTRLLAGGDLSAILADVSNIIDELKEPDMFATGAALRIEANGDIHCAVAGHPPLFHIRASDNAVTDFESQSLPLGVVADETFATTRIDAQPGDILALYTDGLTEARLEDNSLLGLDRLRDILKEAATGSLAQIADTAFNAAARAGKPEDDQSILLIRVAAPRA